MSYLEFLGKYGSSLAGGAGVTLEQTVLATLVAVGVAVTMGLMRLSGNAAVRGGATLYIELFRGTSLLVQLYWIFFVLPLFGLPLEKFTAGFLAVGMNIGAYGAELVRGAVQAVPRGQVEAALALNLTPWVRMRRIIFPQALRIMLPSWGNLLIELLKGTALVALISVPDLMFEAKQANAATFLSIEALGTALLIYYLIARFGITPLMRYWERALARKTSRTQAGSHV